ncbi:MAG: helicase [Ruminococcaceae bacterium]|nr:helicase [Oscillospiraceae bacterium]
MARRTKGETLILVHRNELKQQHIELLSSLNINARVETYQTEYRRLGQHQKPQLLVVDEAHLSKSNTWSKVIEYYDTHTVGMSATPVRLDSRPLGDIYNALVTGVDVKWLIEHNRLAPYEYYAPTTVDTSGLRVVCGDYVTSDLEQLMNERAIYGNVVDSYKRFALGEKSICYCVSVEHAKKTAEKFNEAGISAEVLSAKTPSAQRQRIMESFRNGSLTVLCNCTLLSEGISIDEISCTMLLRPTESVALGIQQMMRCMRYLPGKTAKIIDFVANYTRVGLPDDDREWSLGEPLKRKKQLNENGDFYIRTCSSCYMTFKTAPVCPFCGAEYPLHPREIKAREEIELQRITAEETAKIEAKKKKARMEVGKCKTLDDLWAIARERGYAPGWVWKMAKVKHITR